MIGQKNHSHKPYSQNDMKIQRITLSGFAGSGKTTVGKLIANQLGFTFISVGGYAREYAEKEYGMSINQFQELCKNDPSIDEMIDDSFRTICNSSTNIVVDYRLGFEFIEHSFNILLTVSDQIASRRISEAKRALENVDPESIAVRNTAMRNRFKTLYNVDFMDVNNYHLVINSDNLSPVEISDLIIEEFNHIVSED